MPEDAEDEVRNTLGEIFGTNVDDPAADGDRGRQTLLVVLIDLILVLGLLDQL